MPPRLGVISFINTLPLYARFLSTCPVELVYDSPTGLNQRITEGLLEISPVSSVHYLNNQDEFVLLPRLSVSSFGAVKSVLLLSQKPLVHSEHQHHCIAVPDDSETSVALLRWYLKQQGFDKVTLSTYPAEAYETALANVGAVLIIGDRALVASQKQLVTSVIDLSSLWVAHTGLPFVFAVWVARRNWLRSHPDETTAILNALCDSRDRVMSNPVVLKQIAKEAVKRTGLTETVILDYYQRALNYDWTPAHTKSLCAFEQILQQAY